MQLDLPFDQTGLQRASWAVLRFVGRSIKAIWEGGMFAVTVFGVTVVVLSTLVQFGKGQGLCKQEFYVHRSVPWQERDIMFTPPLRTRLPEHI